MIDSSWLIPHNTKLLMTESVMTFQEPSHINTVGAEVKTSRAKFPLNSSPVSASERFKQNTAFKNYFQKSFTRACSVVFWCRLSSKNTNDFHDFTFNFANGVCFILHLWTLRSLLSEWVCMYLCINSLLKSDYFFILLIRNINIKKTNFKLNLVSEQPFW